MSSPGTSCPPIPGLDSGGRRRTAIAPRHTPRPHLADLALLGLDDRHSQVLDLGSSRLLQRQPPGLDGTLVVRNHGVDECKQLVTFLRDRRSLCSEMGGHFRPKRPVTFNRTPWALSPVLRSTRPSLSSRLLCAVSMISLRTRLPCALLNSSSLARSTLGRSLPNSSGQETRPSTLVFSSLRALIRPN